MLRRSFRFKAHETKVNPREAAERKVAGWISTLVCIVAYYMFGAGGTMLLFALGSYVAARIWLARLG